MKRLLLTICVLFASVIGANAGTYSYGNGGDETGFFNNFFDQSFTVAPTVTAVSVLTNDLPSSLNAPMCIREDYEVLITNTNSVPIMVNLYDGVSNSYDFATPMYPYIGVEYSASQLMYIVPAQVTQRTVTDGVTNTTTTLTSATAAFVATDVGRSVSGTGIPLNTFIASVTNSTTVILTKAETASASGLTITFGLQGTLPVHLFRLECPVPITITGIPTGTLTLAAPRVPIQMNNANTAGGCNTTLAGNSGTCGSGVPSSEIVITNTDPAGGDAPLIVHYDAYVVSQNYTATQ